VNKIQPIMYCCAICNDTPFLPIADGFLTDAPLPSSQNIHLENKSGLWFNPLCIHCSQTMAERREQGETQIELAYDDDDEDGEEDDDEDDDDDTNTRKSPILA